MKIVLSYAAGFYGRTFEDFAGIAKSLGFSRIQLIPDQAPNLYSDFDEVRVGNLREVLDNLNLEVSMHNVFYDINPLSLVPNIASFAQEVTAHVAALGKDLGSSSLTIHPGYIFPGWSHDPTQRERYYDGVGSKISAITSQLELLGVESRFENGSYCLTSVLSDQKTPFHFGIYPEDMEKIVDASESAYVCLDIGKVLASNLRLEEFVDRVGHRIREVQFSGIGSLNQFIDLCVSRKLNFDSMMLVYEGRNIDHLIDEIGSLSLNRYNLEL